MMLQNQLKKYQILCNGIQESLEERKKEKEIAEQKKLEEAVASEDAKGSDSE